MSERPPYLSDHLAAVEEVGALAGLLALVVHLDNAAGLVNADTLRGELHRIAAQAQGYVSVRQALAAMERTPGGEPHA